MNLLPKDYTSQENIIADCLSEFGLRYEHQQEFWPYTVDFYIPELKMVIEADGKHGHLRKRDFKRDTVVSNRDEVEYILHIRKFCKEHIQQDLKAGIEKLNV